MKQIYGGGDMKGRLIASSLQVLNIISKAYQNINVDS